MSINMKIFELEAPNRAAYRDIRLRKLLCDEVLIKVAYSGICGTDIAFYTGDTNLVRSGLAKYPIRIGHEWSGIAEAVGDAVTGFKEGDRVVGDSGVACGRCPACGEKDYQNCKDIRSVGTINCWDGSFAEYIIMPERHLYHVPDCISLECASLIEPATISYNGLTRCDISGKTVAIIGTGPIGMTGVALARHMGAKNVIMIGRTESKLDIARSIGANHVINSTKENLADSVDRCTGGHGADLVVEASGAIREIQNACAIAARKGVVALLAFYDRSLNEFSIDDVVMKEVSITGIMGAFGAPELVIGEITKGNIDFAPIITHRIDFCDLLETFEKFGDMKDRIKVTVKM